MKTNEKYRAVSDFEEYNLICDCDGNGEIIEELIWDKMYQIKCSSCGRHWRIPYVPKPKLETLPVTYEEFRKLVWRLHVHGGDAQFKADIESTKGYSEVHAILTTFVHMKTLCDKWIKKVANAPIH